MSGQSGGSNSAELAPVADASASQAVYAGTGDTFDFSAPGSTTNGGSGITTSTVLMCVALLGLGWAVTHRKML